MTMKEKRAAVLFDADNLDSCYGAIVLGHARKNFGSLVVKRAYGNFSLPALAPWEELAERLDIEIFESGWFRWLKSASDFNLAEDALTMFHEGVANAFCIATSDGDMTEICARLSAKGAVVWGYGDSRAPSSLIGACAEFFQLKGIFHGRYGRPY